MLLVLDTVATVDVDDVVADVTTVPVDLSLSADTEDIISILSTVAEEIKISLSSELIWNKDPNALVDCDGTIITLITSGAKALWI